jgi:hypothetical protein
MYFRISYIQPKQKNCTRQIFITVISVIRLPDSYFEHVMENVRNLIVLCNQPAVLSLGLCVAMTSSLLIPGKCNHVHRALP